MKIINKIKTLGKTLKGFFSRLPGMLAQRPFCLGLGLQIVAIILIGVFFYYYAFLPQVRKAEFKPHPLKFRQDLSQEFLTTLSQRAQKLNKTETKIYPDLFGPQLTE